MQESSKESDRKTEQETSNNQPAKKLKILFLGGTGFLGPHTVNAAIAQGHEVTLFNRGKTNPEMFSELEKIKGDRNTADIQKLANRKWDVVIDTSAYYPRSVNMAMEVLKENISQYLLVSTISVYADWSKPGMDESTPVGTIEDPTVEEVNGQTYGPLKALCEQAAEKQMPGKVCTIRPGLIVGPRDKTDRFTYWPVRIKKGGDVLAPGDGSDFIQYIDVRDLAEWMVYCVEQNINGIFNAQTNGSDITMKQLLDTCVKVINPAANLVWADKAFLQEQEVAPWQEMPVWIPAEGEYGGSGMMSSAKAYANGLKERPMEVVIKDCYDWFTTLPEERQANLKWGIKAEKEAKVLGEWKSKQNSPA
ncbi:NAD-dependent epimerase/dehydratase family protein [Aliikangiella marina]|uniref:NAD-dependent epimerase/dehydratase family protein n=2 Tax=Aliikangiella marina TaxID=1712262 RepID=A0A545T5B3_9GAMM|nr:NAD-dependent epimerase/dehydratase family protein [Aliikangiella marina]